MSGDLRAVWPCDDYEPPLTCWTVPRGGKTLICEGCQEAFPNGPAVQALYGGWVEGMHDASPEATPSEVVERVIADAIHAAECEAYVHEGRNAKCQRSARVSAQALAAANLLAAVPEAGAGCWVVDATLPDGFVHTTPPRATEWEALLGARRIAQTWNYGWPTDRIRVRKVSDV